MVELLNEWTGTDVGWFSQNGSILLRGSLVPGEDSWGRPAFIVTDESVRPDADFHCGVFLSVLTDGRVIPYRPVKGFDVPFDLSRFSYPLPKPEPSPEPVVDFRDANVRVLPMDDNRLTVFERSLAWVCFWPEWVARQIARQGRISWQYLVALHQLWTKEQQEGRDDGNT